MEGGMQIAPVGPMGVAIAINFQPTGGGKAAITGDFVLTGDEVNPVIKALRANGIDVTAVHSHMLDEQPRLFFLHFWAVDDAVRLAKGLLAALAIGSVSFGISPVVAESAQRLSGAQIRAKFAGMQLTDEVHFRDVYERDGTLTSYSMGAKK